jgi:hypothetical protein
MMTVPIIIDFEASGYGHESYPIEVGFSGRHGEGWCSLIRPEQNWSHWDENTAERHLIPREILIERGNTTQFIAEQLNFFLKDRQVYSDTLEQDQQWLQVLYDSAQIQPCFQVMDLFSIISDTQKQLWESTKIQVIKELGVARHRASSQARILQMTWLRTYDCCHQ